MTAPSSCWWTAFSNADWIKFSGNTTGSGNGTVAFSADANTTQDQRATYITIQRQSLRMVQQGTIITVIPDATLNPGSLAAGEAKTFSLSVIDPLGASDLTGVSYFLSGTGQSCSIYASINGAAVYFYLLQDNGSYSTPVLAGSTASISNSTCTSREQPHSRVRQRRQGWRLERLQWFHSWHIAQWRLDRSSSGHEAKT